MTPKQVVALRGAANADIQAALAGFARRALACGVRVAGVVEVLNEAARSPCEAFVLRDVVTAQTYPIYQELGSGSTACRLDSRGMIAACEAVCRQVRAGCDLVVLSKFAKLEAARTGLMDAFVAAAYEGIPIVTAVSPMFSTEWERFSAPLAAFVPPHAAVLDDWWRALRKGTPASSFIAPEASPRSLYSDLPAARSAKWTEMALAAGPATTERT